MKKIKLVIVINDFLVGGAQRLTADLISRFNPQRFDVILVTLFQFEGRNTMYHLVPKDVDVRRFNFTGFTDIRSWFSLAQFFQKEQPDVVLSNLFFSNTVTRVLKPFFKYKSIIVEHNTYIHKTWLERQCDHWLAKITYAIVAVSNSVKTFTAQQEKISLSKFEVIHNGINIAGIQRAAAEGSRAELMQEYSLDAERTYIISVGRLISQKNHALLIDGFAQFATTHPDHDLLIVGDGGLRKALEDQAQRLMIEDRVHFLGNQSDVFRFYTASQFFVSTSIIEGFGLAHAEALACGLPVVSTKTAGPDTMIEEGRNGFFITERTADGVAAGLTRMVNADPALMREYALEVAARYDIARTIKAYEALIGASLLATHTHV